MLTTRRVVAVAVGLAIELTTFGATLAAPGGSNPLPTARGHYVTAVSGEITADTTWTMAGSPYRVSGQFWVRGAATLTVEAGVVVEFDREGELLVEGSLIAQGQPDARVTFDGVDQVAGSWHGIVLLGQPGTPGTIRLEHTTVAHADGRGVAQIDVRYGAIDALDSEIRDGANGGLSVDAGSITLRRTSITGNQGIAVKVLRLSNEAPVADPVFDQTHIAGNGVNAVVLGAGHITADTIWEDPGAPYRLDFQVFVDAPAELTVEPGVEVRSTENGEFVVGGSLVAHGTAESPVRFVGDTDTPAAWRGIQLRGTADIEAEASFRHATVANAGLNLQPAIEVFNGRLVFSDGTVTGIAGDAIRFANGSVSGYVDGSSITDIGGAGIANATDTMVVAPNNWWGSAAGPSAGAGCVSGDGTRVEGLVQISPWLRAGDQRPDPLIPADIPTLTLVPQRWFAPADGQTRVWVDAYLRDPHGQPIPGATVLLGSTLGAVTTSGITDAAGHTLAYLTSTQTGDADISASLSNTDDCRQPESTVAKVTFTDAGDGLLAGMQAPYLFDGIAIDPEPITAGTPTTISARITNPNDAPIKVEAFFAFVQSSIGLAFGPLGDPQTKEIPAKGEQTFALTWTPSLSGHYCIEVNYRIVEGPGAVAPPALAAVGEVPLPPMPGLYQQDAGGGGGGGGGGRGQRNLQVYPGPGGSGSRDSHPILQKAAEAIDWVSKLYKGPAKYPAKGAKKLTGWQSRQGRPDRRRAPGRPAAA